MKNNRKMRDNKKLKEGILTVFEQKGHINGERLALLQRLEISFLRKMLYEIESLQLIVSRETNSF